MSPALVREAALGPGTRRGGVVLHRKVLLISNYNAVRRPWNGVAYEFFNVVAGLENAAIVAPAAAAGLEAVGSLADLARAAGRELGGRMRGVPGRGFAPRM